MKTLTQTHTEHEQLISEISFLQNEIKFFLKLLSKEYAVSINEEKLKLLDAYWKEFETCIEQLLKLERRIRLEEKGLADFLYDRPDCSYKFTMNDNQDLFSEFFNILDKVKTLKKSFYEYMSGDKR